MHIKNLLFAALIIPVAFASPAYAQEKKNPYIAPKSDAQIQYEQEQQQNGGQQNAYQPYGPQQQEEDASASVLNPYNEKYRPVTKATMQAYQDILDERAGKPKKIRGLLPSARYDLRFIRMPGAQDGEAILRVETPIPITGCLNIKQPVVTIKDRGSLMELVLSEVELTLDKTARYAHFQCDTRNKYAYADIPISRDDLLEKGIKKIALRNNVGRFGELNVDVSEHRILAVSKPTALSAGTQVKASTYWFYPENTVILTAPRSKMDKAARADIARLAQARGLSPLGADYEDLSGGAQDALFFVDSSGALAEKLAAAGKPLIVDVIQVNDIFSGPEGPYEKAKNVEVFARLPNMFE